MDDSLTHRILPAKLQNHNKNLDCRERQCWPITLDIVVETNVGFRAPPKTRNFRTA
jgi:hypothetical protein